MIWSSKRNLEGAAIAGSLIVLASIIGLVTYSPILSLIGFGATQSITVNVRDTNGNPVTATVQGLMEGSAVGRGATGLEQVFNGTTDSNGQLLVTDLSKVNSISRAWVSYQGAEAKYFSPRVLLFITHIDSNGSLYFGEDSVPLITLDFLNGKSAVVTHTIDLTHPVPHVNVVQTNGAQLALATSGPSPPPSPSPCPSQANNCYWVLNYTNGPYPSSGTAHIPVAWGEVFSPSYGLFSVDILASGTDYSNTGYAIGSGGGMSNPTYYSGSAITSFQNTANYEQTVILNSAAQVGEIWINGQVEGQSFYLEDCYYMGRYGLHCFSTDIDLYQIGIVNVPTSGGQISGGWDQNLPSYSSSSYFIESFASTQAGSTQLGDGSQTPTYKLTSYDLSAQWVGNKIQYWANLGLTGAGLIPLLPGQVAGALGSIIQNLVAPMGSLSTSHAVSWFQFDAPVNYDVYPTAYVSTAGWQVSGMSNAAYMPVNGYGALAYQSGGGGGCVLSGTMIALANGSEIPVQDLAVGQKVLAYDTQTNEFVTTTVYSDTASKVSQVVDINNGLLYASGLNDQPIFAKFQNGTQNWINLGELQPGMELFQPSSGRLISVTSIQHLSGSYIVYDVRTVNAEINNYIANGVLVDIKI